jgi:hypothetical protein
MEYSPERNRGGRDEDRDDVSWIYGNPDDDLFDEHGDLKFPPYEHEDLQINPATGKPYTEEELARGDRTWAEAASPEGSSSEADPSHPEA